MSQEFRKYNHQALWEEEKHFTWWISVIFPALFFILISTNIQPILKIITITLGCIFGILLSFFGFIVIRKEGIYFTDALETFCRTCKALELNKPSTNKSEINMNLPLMPDYPINKSFEIARQKANKPIISLIINLLKPSTLKIRDCFQLIFIFSSFIFLALLILSWIIFLNTL